MAAQTQSQTLGNIAKAEPGADKVLVGLVVARVAMFFGVDWNEMQCMMCTEEIISHFDGLKVNEFKIFTERVTGGAYKSQKNLTPALLIEWLYDFVKEVRSARQEAKHVYEPPTDLAPIEVVEEIFGQIKAALRANRDDEQPVHVFPSLEATIEKMKENSRKAFKAEGWTDEEIDDYVTNGIFPERFKK